jgi:hypothetical protein
MRIVKLFGQFSRTLTFACGPKIKLYRPEEAPDFKWRNTCPGHYIQGLKTNE